LSGKPCPCTFVITLMMEGDVCRPRRRKRQGSLFCQTEQHNCQTGQHECGASDFVMRSHLQMCHWHFCDWLATCCTKDVTSTRKNECYSTECVTAPNVLQHRMCYSTECVSVSVVRRASAWAYVYRLSWKGLFAVVRTVSIDCQ
jgi:hypothetical protein